MKKTLAIMIAAALTIPGFAQKENKKEEPIFTTIKANPVTPVKNQNRSGTCWNYATLGFIEAELLHNSGKTYDLSEMFVCHHDYVDCAEYNVRMHGYSKFSQGGSCDDAFQVIRRHGIIPEEAMTPAGSLVGDSLANFNEFFNVLEPYVEGIANSKMKQLTPQWKVALNGILDAYLGKCPKTFQHEGREYTPKEYAQSLPIDWNNYSAITSFTHHPFNSWFVIEAPYKWRPCPSYNLPLETMMDIIDKALDKGYTIAWGGDVSGIDFNRNGFAAVYDIDQAAGSEGSDMARWLKLKASRGSLDVATINLQTPEIEPTQELRQEWFDNWKSTYDHVMLIYGKAQDQYGRKYYMVKNSWGTNNKYKGTWYMSRNFIALYTTYIYINRDALDKKLTNKMRMLW